MTRKGLIVALVVLTGGCEQSEQAVDDHIVANGFQVVGQLESRRLNEASGIQAGSDGRFFLHNDDGDDLFAIDASGRHLGRMKVRRASNQDWEDITRVPGAEGPLLVIGDIGDNHRSRSKRQLYFVAEPPAGHNDGELNPVHRLILRMPGRPTDIEAMAYDPSSRMILFLTKADQPPVLYGVYLDDALAAEELPMERLGEVPGFRPPTRIDIVKGLHRGLRVAQPTGMDISADGRLAAIITYRSLYLFSREPGESWIEAFQRPPVEYLGPPGLYDEAVTFSADGRYLYVTTERRPAPLSRLELD
jgi:hypothetical protein